jgi:16S rRNA (guanine(1405)-N(7))-methyltransferase
VTTRLLDGLQADFLLLSYPVHSLGGRSKGMRATYEKHFAALAAERQWQARCFEFETELAYLIQL